MSHLLFLLSCPALGSPSCLLCVSPPDPLPRGGGSAQHSKQMARPSHTAAFQSPSEVILHGCSGASLTLPGCPLPGRPALSPGLVLSAIPQAEPGKSSFLPYVNMHSHLARSVSGLGLRASRPGSGPPRGLVQQTELLSKESLQAFVESLLSFPFILISGGNWGKSRHGNPRLWTRGALEVRP